MATPWARLGPVATSRSRTPSSSQRSGCQNGTWRNASGGGGGGAAPGGVGGTGRTLGSPPHARLTQRKPGAVGRAPAAHVEALSSRVGSIFGAVRTLQIMVIARTVTTTPSETTTGIL
jgi:hypothetical protein